MIISRSVLLRMKNVSDKIFRENQNTIILKNIFSCLYKIKWKNVIQPDRPQMKIWHVRISRWIPKDKIIH